MKKFLIGIITLICCVSCFKPGDSIYTSKNDDIQITCVVARGDYPWSIIDITYKGETHTYVSSAHGLAHWEGCEYCKHEDSN